MITLVEKCPFCDKWQMFEKKSKRDDPSLPWACEECGEQVIKFPKRDGSLGRRVDNIWT